MATQADVRRIALSLPGTEETPNHFVFSVRNNGKLKKFAWVWMERVAPRKARVPQPRVLGVRVANLDDKEVLLALDRAKFFTESHYNGFPAVLVRLAAVTARELRPLITEAWRTQAPKDAAARTPAPRRAPGPSRTRTRAEPGSLEVDAFFTSLRHPAKAELVALRKIILGADRRIGEGIKWKVPSFRTSDYFATLHLRARDGVQVILHLGARSGKSAAGVTDPAGLLEWLARDRAIVRFRDIRDIRVKRAAFTALLRQWITHL